MLVPKFTLDQSADSVTIKIYSPYSNIEDTEVYVDKNEFIFSSSPYHLRLVLAGAIIDNDRSSGKYEAENGYYTFKFDKVNKGEHFPNLDMVTSLLAPKEMPDLNPDLIEVINSTSDDAGILEQSEISPHSLNADVAYTNHKFAYGFANKLKGNFKDFGGEFPNIFELKTPEEISFEDRKRLMEEHENGKFSSDHYLADFFEEDLIKPLLNYEAPWENISSKTEVNFTKEEIDTLKDLPNKEYLLTKDEFDKVTFNLVDIIYAYCYEKRVTCNENTIESSWTINRISGTLSWFAVFFSLNETLVSCYRRSLIYPIYRNFKLSNKVKEDVEKIFLLGRKYIVKCLVEIYNMFNLSQDARYILNQLYIKDFLIFSQKCDEKSYKSIYDDLCKINLTKLDLNLELEDFEAAGKMVQMEESQILENAMALKLSSMKLTSDDENEQKKMVYKAIDMCVYDDSDDSSDTSDSSSSSSSSELDSDDDSSSS